MSWAVIMTVSRRCWWMCYGLLNCWDAQLLERKVRCSCRARIWLGTIRSMEM